MQFIKRTLPVLLGIFLLSVVVRLPQLGRPLSKHHEFCTAISLRVMQIWFDGGIEKYHYAPVMNFEGSTNKFINNHANASGRVIDAAGNYYYVSHPPFAYYAPYFLFRLLKVRPDVLPLQAFNLLLHFISALFVYFTVCLLSFNRARSLPFRPAVVAFVIYCFLPVTLWFQGNVYMSDMAVHTLFIIGVYVALKMILRQQFYSPKYIIYYVMVLGLMVYTSWLGVFFAAGVLVYSLLHVQTVKGFKVLIGLTFVVTLMVLQVVTYQYAQINGLSAYVAEMLHRYLERGSVADTQHGLLHFMFSYLWYFKTIVYNYLVHYLVFYALMLLFIWLVFTRRKMKIVFSENGYRFIWLSVAPVLALHFFFLNYSAHDFTVLYASLFFSVLFGILYDKVKRSGAMSLAKMRLGVAAVVGCLLAQYYIVNDWLVKQPDWYLKNGSVIAQQSAKDEVVFLQGVKPEPQLVFYAQRNIQQVKDSAEAMAFLKARQFPKGVMFLQNSTTGVLVSNNRLQLLY